MNEDEQSPALLRTLDQLPGADHLEFSDGFDYSLAKAQATRLEARLTRGFRRACALDDHVQDASSYFRIALPAEAAEAGVPLGVRLSDFGNLAVVTTPRPDSHALLNQAVQEGTLTAAD